MKIYLKELLTLLAGFVKEKRGVVLVLCVILMPLSVYSQKIAIKTNALEWATVSPNISAEFVVSPTMSLDLSASFNEWTPDANAKFEDEEDGIDKVKAMKETYHKLDLDCLVVLGGNGSQKTANLLSEEGLNVIGLPKTIDNDLWGTDMTFGFQSAVDIATSAIDCIHTTAASHNRVFLVEIMGHKVGHITLHAGIAGGADIILIPEIPYDIKKVCKALEKRSREGKGFSIIAVAEGAISKEDAALPKKKRKEKIANRQYPSVAYEIADQIKDACGCEVRIAVPGHTQRGGSPKAYDRVLSSRFGAYAAQLIGDEKYGRLVVLKDNEVTDIALSESAGKLKYVSPEDSIVRNAKALGISFGDE